MKALTFKYTKKDGSVSERTLLAMITPTDKYAGIDVSELDPKVAAQFIKEMQLAHDEYIDYIRHIQESFDLKHNYRQFLESGMSDITQI